MIGKDSGIQAELRALVNGQYTTNEHLWWMALAVKLALVFGALALLFAFLMVVSDPGDDLSNESFIFVWPLI